MSNYICKGEANYLFQMPFILYFFFAVTPKRHQRKYSDIIFKNNRGGIRRSSRSYNGTEPVLSKRGGTDGVFRGLAGLLQGISQGQNATLIIFGIAENVTPQDQVTEENQLK